MTVFKISAIETLALAAVALGLGTWLRARIPVLTRLNIPASIAGGLAFAMAHWMARSRTVTIDFDTSLRDPLMLACFSIIGFNASVRVLWHGGRLIGLLLALAAAGALLQNVVGAGLAKAFGLNPLIGVLAGSVSLAGGPATSQAFGATFEGLGVPGAATIALASATFGIAISGLVAGGLGGWLIRRNGLAEPVTQSEAVPLPDKSPAIEAGAVARHGLWIVLVLGAGVVLSRWIAGAGLVMPGYIGAMTVAAVVRNCDDHWGFARLSEVALSEIFAALLPLFIAVAMITLRIWELERLALPLLGILVVQTILTVSFCGISYYWLGRDYDGAVSAAGFCGFMLGITPNAMASMQELVNRYGPAPRAFLGVPVVGAFLIDFVNSVLITATVSALKLIN